MKYKDHESNHQIPSVCSGDFDAFGNGEVVDGKCRNCEP